MSARGATADVQGLVLAAGRSSRIAGDLDGRSKLLVDIGGETVLERNLRWVAASGVREVWINLHYRPEEIRTAVGDPRRFGLQVRYSEEPELLGTAGAFRVLAPYWRDAVLVVYGDNVSRFALRALLERHRTGGAMATLALFDSRLHANSGIAGGRVLVENGRVVAFVEGGGADLSLVNAGVYVLDPGLVEYVREGGAPDFGRDVFPALLAAGQRIDAHLIEPDGYCFGIDTPDALARTREALAAGKVVRP